MCGLEGCLRSQPCQAQRRKRTSSVWFPKLTSIDSGQKPFFMRPELFLIHKEPSFVSGPINLSSCPSSGSQVGKYEDSHTGGGSVGRAGGMDLSLVPWKYHHMVSWFPKIFPKHSSPRCNFLKMFPNSNIVSFNILINSRKTLITYQMDIWTSVNINRVEVCLKGCTNFQPWIKPIFESWYTNHQ